MRWVSLASSDPACVNEATFDDLAEDAIRIRMNRRGHGTSSRRKLTSHLVDTA